MIPEEINKKINEVGQEVMRGLKDFQRCTVERVDELFRKGQNRVLVADEVGMGKTMIAKGVIAKFAKLKQEEGSKRMKVVYICSNQSIANQNISELDIFRTGHDDIANTRMSMQHLMIRKAENEASGNFIQLIPLTPETSFRQTSGCGIVNERFVMYLVLRQMPVFEGLNRKLERLLKQNVDSWNYLKKRDENYVFNENYKYKHLVKTYENYPKYLDAQDDTNIFAQLEREENRKFLQQIADYLNGGKRNSQTEKEYIIHLRQMFAEISVDMLNPDLVIMDEFQRFQFLLNNQDEDTKILVDKFFNASSNSSMSPVRVLLLSATPYKLYSTLEELGDTNNDESYKEFHQVLNFLNNDKEKNDQFAVVWNRYSNNLKQIGKVSWNEMLDSKNAAEEKMYNTICRTERISVMGDGDYIDDSSKNSPLTITTADIAAHLDASALLSNTTLNISFPIDYIKSCPYALSFMQKYETKKKLRTHFEHNRHNVEVAKSKLLWLNKEKINHYEDLKPVNARFERLKNETFQKENLSRLIWLPPTKPYYEAQGVYKGKENYSKILIFSSWEMVPRMISTLLSYEEERLTVAVLAKENKKRSKRRSLTNTNYFAKKGYPYPRLVAKNRGILCLLYSSKTLASLYNPLEMYRSGVREASKIEKILRQRIEKEAFPLICGHIAENQPIDLRWYYLLPMLMDGLDYLKEWQSGVENYSFKSSKKSDTQNSELENIIREAVSIVETDGWKLGKLPSDIYEVLANMAIASPAICFYRMLKGESYDDFTNSFLVFSIAYDFVSYLNSRVNTAIIDLSIDKTHDEGNHWKNTLLYCRQGNFQAVVDEYVHLLTKGQGVTKDTIRKVVRNFESVFNLSSATYKVESFPEFKHSIESRNKTDERTENRSSLRTHFAVSFSKGDSRETGVTNRKDAVRLAFNSPFWPFVLASTSIGQEGLDFHLYCRKMMHWNLPSNPVDLEQREGRINRFKCLAIRQNVVGSYGDVEVGQEEDDIWNTMFHAAEAERKDGQSELVPYWCFGKNQKIKIERILAQYPLSRDEERYDRLIQILSLYRLTMGQARQEELLTSIFNEYDDVDKFKDLFIDLSPFNRAKSK